MCQLFAIFSLEDGAKLATAIILVVTEWYRSGIVVVTIDLRQTICTTNKYSNGREGCIYCFKKDSSSAIESKTWSAWAKSSRVRMPVFTA